MKPIILFVFIVVFVRDNVIFVRCRFNDYDGRLLYMFVMLKVQSPDTFYNALLREHFSLDDIIKLNCAMSGFLMNNTG